MQGIHLRKYGVAATIPFELYEVDGVDFRVDAVHAAGDSTRVKDGGAEQNTTNGFADEGKGYSITLTAGEMQAAEIVVYIVDQTATKVWLDKAIIIETYGNASAQHAMDLDDAVPTATEIVDEWETQSQADPTGFHVNVREWFGQAVSVSVTLKPNVNIAEVDGTAQRATDLAEIAQYLFANPVALVDIIANTSVMAKLLAVNGVMSTYNEITDSQEGIRNKLDALNDFDGTGATLAAGAITASTFAAGAIDAAALAADAATKIAARIFTIDQDHIDIEGTVPAQHTLYVATMRATSRVNTVDNPGFLTMYNTLDAEIYTLALTVDDTADPVTGQG